MADDYVDQLLQRGVISDDAAARMMTHWPQQPEERLETSPPPYRDDAINFASGGVHDVLKGRGVEMPEWMDRAGDVLHGEAFNDALGVTFPQAKILRFRELMAAKTPIEQIAKELGITQGAVRGLAKTKGVPIGQSSRSPRPSNILSEDQAARLADLVKQGKHDWEIAREFGMQEHNVAYTLKRLGIERPPQE